MRKRIKETSEVMKTKYIEATNKNVKKYPNVIVGDLVMIRRHVFTPGISVKLQAVKEGPLRITNVCGSRISLEFVDDVSKTRERHISDLAKYYSRPKYLQKGNQTDEENTKVDLQLEPIMTKGNICTIDCGITALLVIKWDCITYKPNIKVTTEMKTRYSYLSQAGDSRPLLLNKKFVKNPREPGIIYYYTSKTRNANGPIIAAAVLAIREGSSCELRDPQEDEIPDCHTHAIIKDTIENRQKWTKEALQSIQKWIISGNMTITSIYMENCMFQENGLEATKDVWNDVKKFTWNMNTYGIKVFIVTPGEQL